MCRKIYQTANILERCTAARYYSRACAIRPSPGARLLQRHHLGRRRDLPAPEPGPLQLLCTASSLCMSSNCVQGGVSKGSFGDLACASESSSPEPGFASAPSSRPALHKHTDQPQPKPVHAETSSKSGGCSAHWLGWRPARPACSQSAGSSPAFPPASGLWSPAGTCT